MRKRGEESSEAPNRAEKLWANFLRKFGRQGFGFAIAGLAGVVSDLAVFNLLFRNEVDPRLASIVAALVGLGLNFLINLLAFSTLNLPRKILFGTLTKYLTVAGLSTVYVLVAFEMVLAVLHPETAAGLTGTRVAIIASGTLIRFFLYRHWVFRAQEDRG